MRNVIAGLLLLAACGGGDGGGSGGGPGPGPAYADTTSSGLAVANAFAGAATIAPFVVAAVSEQEMNADLNGDGDMLDQVAHQLDTSTGAVANFGFPIVGPVITSNAHFAFLVSEGGLNNTDLNADGDATDAIWHVYDPARPLTPGINPLNTLLATPANGLPGAGTRGGFVLMVLEAASNLDLNGDGDMIDEVPAAFEGAAFRTSTLTLPAHAPGTPLVSRNARILYAISEPADGVDQNGDGDLLDVTLGVVDFTQAIALFTRVGGQFGRAVANHPYALTDTGAAYFVDEATNAGADLNNDGDATDAVIAVYDLATGGGESLPSTPLIPSFAVAGATSVGIGAGPNRIIVGVSEAGQGTRDINNDFDTNDAILAWVSTTAPTTLHMLTAFALGGVAPCIDGPRGLVVVSEGAVSFGGTDLNGDGDTSDNVVHVLDATVAPGVMTNLSLAAASYALQGDDALIGVDEAADKGIDRNGDSMADDIVQVYCDLGANPSAMRSLAVVATRQTFFRLSDQELRIAAVLPEGQSPVFNDLNRDGDTNDSGVELITLNPSGVPPALVAPTPFFVGVESFGTAPPLRVGNDTFAFATSEAMAGVDLNADGDLLDTVLQYAKINQPN